MGDASALAHLWNTDKELYLDDHPVFVRMLIKSHVEHSFLMRIPSSFSSKHLPKRDTMMTLETDIGERYEAKYLNSCHALSGGWRGFAMGQKLMKDDVAVFQLVEQTRFKIYIIRKGSTIVKLPTTILNLLTEVTPGEASDALSLCISCCILLIHPRFISRMIATAEKKQVITYKRRNARERLAMSNQTSKSKIHFTSVTGFEHFRSILTDSLQNHELSEVTLLTYYELCRAKNTFLHIHLSKGLNTQFFGGAIGSIIFKTVSISNAITSCTISTFLCNFSDWNKTLKYHEGLHMNVGFLISRVRNLRDLAANSEGAVNASRYMEACRECPRAEREVRKLETILVKLRKISTSVTYEVNAMKSTRGRAYLEVSSRLAQVEDEIRKIEILIVDFAKFFEYYHEIIEGLKVKADDHNRRFKEAASAPW